MRARGALALVGVAVAAALPAGAQARAQPSVYRIAKATGTEQVTFAGSQAAGCTSRGACDTSGTVTYSFGGSPRDAVFFLLPGRAGFGFFGTDGITTASVTAGPGTQPCTDTVRHRFDFFGLAPHGGKLEYTTHFGDPDAGDYLDTRCAGPIEQDLARAGALPSAPFSARGFRGRKIKFSAVGSKGFGAGGFSGTVSWRFAYTLVRTRHAAASLGVGVNEIAVIG